MELEIFKFGGTALATRKNLDAVIKTIKAHNDKKIIVVVSAIGREGYPYATETFLKHLSSDKITLKERDRYLACGEIISSVLLSELLNNEGIKAYSLSYLELGFLSDNNYSSGYIKEINNDAIVSYLNDYDVLIAPGFVASSEEGEVITLGRGASDLTAVLLGQIMKKDQVVLYKDVEGVYPFLITNLKGYYHYSELSYQEMLMLYQIGYKIINKDAIVEAETGKITLVVQNVLNDQSKTIISSKYTDKEIVGFNVVNNEFLIATAYPCKVQEEIRLLAAENHIFFKDEQIGDNIYRFTISNSQIFLLRRMIIQKYFKNFTK